MSDWREGADISDLRGGRILHSRYLGVSLSHFAVEQYQLGESEEEIIDFVFEKFTEWKEGKDQRLVLEVLNKVPLERVYDNIENTVEAQISQYKDSVKMGLYLDSRTFNSQGIGERPKIYLSGKIWRGPAGIMIDNVILEKHKDHKDCILRFMEKVSGKIFEAEFEDYFSDKAIDSEFIKFANPNMKLLSLGFFKEIAR